MIASGCRSPTKRQQQTIRPCAQHTRCWPWPLWLHPQRALLGWLHTGAANRCTSCGTALQLLSPGMCPHAPAGDVSCSAEQQNKAAEQTSATLEEPSMKYVTAENTFETSCWHTGFPSFQSFSFQDKTGVCRWETCTTDFEGGMP